MRYVGIDYGLSRTGLAISDPDEKMAFPLATVYFSDFKTRSEMLDHLAQVIIAAEGAALVIGYPKPLTGPDTLICRQVLNVTKRLWRRLQLPCYLMNEALSSFEALADLKACGVKTRLRKKVLDQQAAVRILESFLNCQNRPCPLALP
ncbi:MAG: Holliday junction resolvase RuvX [Desulfovibrionaceae bacterium]|nr:Holliday junction resolvase RuvX [Desulfovibrionaceae bacterium]